MHPEFDSLTTTAGIEILDPIESRRFTLRTSTPVTPTPTTTDDFAFPVDVACRIRTDELALPHPIPVNVRSCDGTHRDSVSPPARREFPADEYLLDLHAPIKLYLRVAGPLTVVADTDGVTFEFGGETTILVGARSYHSEPAGTITVPDDPNAHMEAVSAFASSLKTTSPERAWPTLRGHPPKIERGDELAIPDGLDAPDTGIAIEVPPEYGHVYGVGPLAFYLGADVVPGPSATLRTDDGLARSLGDDAATVAEAAGDLLQRVLLLDCVVRTEGYYPVDLHEREVLEPQVNRDFAALYDASPTDRLRAYLSVADEAVESITPTWHRVTHVQPGPAAVELLPYVAKDLSLVRVQTPGDAAWTATESQRTTEDAVESFVRRAAPVADRGRRTAPTDDFVRSAGSATRSPADEEGEFGDAPRGVPGVGEYVPLPDVDALEQAYVGDKTPESGAKLLAAAFENDDAELDGVVDITVVCNDEAMREEWDAVSEIYGERDDLYIDVDCRFGVTTDELRDLLTEHHDVFHFIGHIDGLGFQCPDGILDAETVEATGAATLLLNGCRSHDQGVALIEAGANAAVVSLGDVANQGAVEVGETLARLLHHGFSIGSAMAIVREHTSIGRDYLVVGNPGATVAQCESGTPTMFHVEDECFEGEQLGITSYSRPVLGFGVGSQFKPYLPDVNSFSVAIGECGRTTITRTELRSRLLDNPEPLVVDEELVWSSNWFETV